jgi:hypothetical protein
MPPSLMNLNGADLSIDFTRPQASRIRHSRSPHRWKKAGRLVALQPMTCFFGDAAAPGNSGHTRFPIARQRKPLGCGSGGTSVRHAAPRRHHVVWWRGGDVIDGSAGAAIARAGL